MVSSFTRAIPVRRPKGAAAAGFTLIELMVAVAVIGILVGVGLPEFRQGLQNSRVKGAGTDMFLSLLLARSEGIKRSANIDLVRGGGAWTDGWSVQVASDSTVLRSNDALKGDLTLDCNTDTDTGTETCPASVTFNRSGKATSIIEYRFYISGNDAVRMRCVVMSLSGRPSLLVDNDVDPTNGCM